MNNQQGIPPTSGTTRGNTIRRRWAGAREGLATQLWPIPVLAIAASVILGIALPILDSVIDDSLDPAWSSFIFDGGTDSARAVLSAIAGSLITATSLTFSLTVVALQLASSQASPRILRMFSKDPMVHNTLAVFLGTFAFALTVLRTVEDSGANSAGSVPRIAVTLASFATLASVIMLTLFLAHLATQLRIETMMRDVHKETRTTIRLVAETAGDGLTEIEVPDRLRTAAPALRSGFLSSINRARLISLARTHDLIIEEVPTVGSSVIKGVPLAWWWRRDPLVHTATGDDIDAEISRIIAGAFGLTYERTASQDIGFGLRQLVDIGVRALSPGINDPTTAMHALSHISALLCDLAALPAQPRAVSDDDGVVRLLQRTHDFESLLELAIQQPRRYGSSDPKVAERLYEMLQEVAFVTEDPDRKLMVSAQLSRLDASVAAVDYDTIERARLAHFSTRATAALSNEWIPAP